MILICESVTLKKSGPHVILLTANDLFASDFLYFETIYSNGTSQGR